MEPGSGKKILVIDTETTGLEDNDQLIQLAWGWWDGSGGLTESHSFKCMPTIKWKSEWHDEHNLSMEDITGHPKLSVSMLQPFMNDVKSADYILGYNVDFDMTVLERELARLGEDSTSLSSKQFIDPMAIWNKSEGRKLVDAHKRWVGTDLEGAHDAEADVAGAVAIIPGMLREFGLDEMTIENLVQMCRENDDVDRTGKMKWLDGKPILMCTKFDYYNGSFPKMTVFEATWSDGGEYARKYPSFKTMGYECHKSVIDAFRLALNHHNDESGFIAAMIERFGPPRVNDESQLENPNIVHQEHADSTISLSNEEQMNHEEQQRLENEQMQREYDEQQRLENE